LITEFIQDAEISYHLIKKTDMNKRCQKVVTMAGLIVFAIYCAGLTFTDINLLRTSRAETVNSDKSKPELVPQTGHGSTVNAVVFDPDNRWVATGSTDSTVIIWDIATGRELRVLQGHEGAVRALSCSRDGRLIASGASDKLIKLWDVQTGKELLTLTSHKSMVESLAFSGDGKSLASGGADNSVIIWDVKTGQSLSTFSEHTGSVKSLAFSPNDLFLASGGSDQVIKIWDLKKQRSIKTIKNTGVVTVLRYSSDGEQIASGNTEAIVKIWKTASGKEIASLKGHKSKILSLFFLNNEKLLSVSADQTVKAWDLANSSEISSRVIQTEKSSDIESAAVSQDGRILAAGNGDRTADIFNTSDGKKLLTLENQTFGYYCISFSTDGRWFAAGSIDNSIKLWDLETGQGLPPLKGHLGDVTSIVFHPDNKRLISSSMDGTIRIWNLLSGEPPQVIKAHNNYVTSIAVSKNGRFIVSGSSDQTVKVWDLESKTEIYNFKDYPGAVTSVAVSPDGSLIAAGGADKSIKLWGFSTKKPLLTLSGHADNIETVAFNPNGQLIASGSDDKTVKIWDVASGQCLRTFSGNSEKVNDLTFSPDGNYLASAGQDKSIHLWEVLSGKEDRVLNEQSGAIKALAFSNNGNWIASGADDGSVVIWKKETGESLAIVMSLRDDWLVVTPQGFFDGAPESWNRLIWRFENNTFNTQPVEVFFSEFYYPGLLSELLAGKAVPQSIDISKKDRRQPQVKIERSDNQDGSDVNSGRAVKVKIQVSQFPPDSDHVKGSGARDVRLFRNGSLVKLWDGDVLIGKSDQVVLEATVPLVSGQNQITACAFNNDNIKSSDYTLSVNGSESLKRKGTLYILGVAVGKNSNSNFDLTNIDFEALEFAKQLNFKQSELEQFERIEVIPLINEAATKKNILSALKALTSDSQRLPVSSNNDTSVSIPDFAKLKPAAPEDTIFVYFTGHGVSHDNHFYMLPYDLGYTNPSQPFNEQLKTILDRGISDLELREVLKDIDASRLVLIIDACNSGQIVESEEARQGPMNAKGLAQLAFDKGMFILTASQSRESAYVSKALKRSYLTYALIEEGLKSTAADVMPADGRLSLKEWFDYAVMRVPQLRSATVTGNSPNENTKGVEESKVSEISKENSTSVKSQSPRAFYRRQIDLQPMIVARVGNVSRRE
jgi:WD40 repeat protein